jgi:hypothetical protein
MTSHVKKCIGSHKTFGTTIGSSPSDVDYLWIIEVSWTYQMKSTQCYQYSLTQLIIDLIHNAMDKKFILAKQWYVT